MNKNYELFSKLVDVLDELKIVLYKQNYVKRRYDNGGIELDVINRDVEIPEGLTFEQLITFAKGLLATEQERLANSPNTEAEEDSDGCLTTLEDVINSREWDEYGPHRKFYNEVTLPEMCLKVLEEAENFLPPIPGEGNFIVDIYDMSNYGVSFITKEEAEEFINCFGRPLTLYENRDGYEIELYSV